MFEWLDELIFRKNKYMKQKKCHESMVGQLCIITGATSGVGYEAAKKIAEAGAHVVMVCRNEDKAKIIRKELKSKYNVFIDIIIADFGDLDSVRLLAKELLLRYPKIDVLVNNVGMYSTQNIHLRNGYEMVFCVNHLASFLLTYLLIGRLIESSPSRIIDVNSEGHRFNGLNVEDINWEKRHYTGLKGDGAAKTAQLLTVWDYHDLLKDTGVTINALHPGDVKTNRGSNNGWLYRIWTHHVTYKKLKNPIISGEAIYYLAASKDMKGVSGNFYNLTHEEKPAKHALDRKLGKKIWSMSMEMVGLSS